MQNVSCQKMDIKKTIEEFLLITIQSKTAQEDLFALIAVLDELACSTNNVNYVFDETDFPDSPQQDYQQIREKVRNAFPTLGYYNTAQETSENLEATEVVVGDSIDDITDIAIDLNDVLWCYSNTSENDAMWHYLNSYKTHWGKHLRELQLYLYGKCN